MHDPELVFDKLTDGKHELPSRPILLFISGIIFFIPAVFMIGIFAVPTYKFCRQKILPKLRSKKYQIDESSEDENENEIRIENEIVE